MALLAEDAGLLDPLRLLIQKRAIPVWGTCAGLILLAAKAGNTKEGGQKLIGGLDIAIQRNAFGRQAQSFVMPLEIGDLGAMPFPGVFIRAPAILPPDAGAKTQVRVLARLPEERGGHIVAVREGVILGTAFHPELTNDSRMHEYFINMIKEL